MIGLLPDLCRLANLSSFSCPTLYTEPKAVRTQSLLFLSQLMTMGDPAHIGLLPGRIFGEAEWILNP